MKELISAIVTILFLVGGGVALKRFHDDVRNAALKKAAQGLPSLTEMNRGLQQPKRK